MRNSVELPSGRRNSRIGGAFQGGQLGKDRRTVGQLRGGYAGAEQLARDADQRGEALVPDLELALGVEHRDAEADVVEGLAQQVGVVADRGGGIVQHLAHRARHP
jgi:hypothetical protein